jgi:ribosomal protein S18 acetylase RimI-like enzyme
MTIREARRQDIPAITALWQEMMDFHRAQDARFRFAANAPREFEKHILATLRSRDALILVAESEGKVVAYVLGEVHTRKPLYPVGRYGFISDLSVQASNQRRGIGRALVEEMTQWLRRKGVTTIELFAAVDNPDSMAFWHAMGYTDFLCLMRRELD